jgi:hypothetical protein
VVTGDVDRLARLAFLSSLLRALVARWRLVAARLLRLLVVDVPHTAAGGAVVDHQSALVANL